MSMYIRPYHPADLIYMYQICLQTADSGKDATTKYNDPNLVGHMFAAPYAVLEPGLCFVLTEEGVPVGYIVGTGCSETFYHKCEKKWFPRLRDQYALPNPNDASLDARITRLIHRGHEVNNDLIDYPAHLHVDLLPVAQGKGMGRKIMNAFLDKLRELQVPGVHLQVGKANPGAIKYYERLGFHVIVEYEKALAFGLKLSR